MDSDVEKAKAVDQAGDSKRCINCTIDYDNGICLLEELITAEILLIKEVRDKFCCKKISFGNSYICTCQTRKNHYYSAKQEKSTI